MTGPHDRRVGAAAEMAVTAPTLNRLPDDRTPGVPLTERILSRLPGARLAWMLIWALVPWVNLSPFASPVPRIGPAPERSR
jgi:hypothetical protein